MVAARQRQNLLTKPPGSLGRLESLELEPLLSLDLRLGEGSGAVVVLPILDAALAVWQRRSRPAAGREPARPPIIR